MDKDLLVPTNKVTTAAITGAVVTIIIWISQTFFHIDPPVVISTAVQFIIMTVAAYVKREKVRVQ